jgi:predicted dehydrogenase
MCKELKGGIMERINIGIIGCGNISGIYLKNCSHLSNMKLVACADLLIERAQEKAKEFGISKACSVEELLSDEAIRIVINLTIPKAHTEVNLRILEAGKHAYTEKPLALTRAEGQTVLAKAQKSGLLVGSAPDTFMGAGQQTCRKLIDDGWIGAPVAATAFMMCHGHESWHPDPEFYYQKGGGPMFDMGPYYLTALVNLLGPVRRVTGMTGISFPVRTITSAKKYGTRIQVEVPTLVTGLMEFESGAIGTIIMTFDVWTHQMPWIEIYGSEGTLRCPDPNTFGGVPLLKRVGAEEWSAMPLTYGFAENSRGIGVADMATALTHGGSFRPQSELAYHVLDIMQAFHESAASGKHVDLQSRCSRPEPMPMQMTDYVLRSDK